MTRDPGTASTPPASPASATDALSIDRLDVAAPGAFAAAVGPLFEGARGFVGRLAMARPFSSVDAFFEGARRIAHAMPVEEQVELIDAHPRLGAPPGQVSTLSFVEQGYDREGPASAPSSQPDLATELARLNDAYEARFGFRYCVFVAGRSRAALLPELVAAFGADRDAELSRALDAVVDIARDRYATMTSAAREAST